MNLYILIPELIFFKENWDATFRISGNFSGNIPSGSFFENIDNEL